MLYAKYAFKKGKKERGRGKKRETGGEREIETEREHPNEVVTTVIYQGGKMYQCVKH